MGAPLPLRILAALLPIIVSPVAFALGAGAQGAYFFGLLLGALFGVTLAYRTPAAAATLARSREQS